MNYMPTNDVVERRRKGAVKEGRRSRGNGEWENKNNKNRVVVSLTTAHATCRPVNCQTWPRVAVHTANGSRRFSLTPMFSFTPDSARISSALRMLVKLRFFSSAAASKGSESAMLN